MPQKQADQSVSLDRIKAVVWRRLPLLLGPLAIIMPVVIVAVSQLPPEYVASSTLLVTEPWVPNPLEKQPARRVDPNQRKINMQQKMLSTSNLMRVVQELGLDREILQDSPVQAMIAKFKSHIPALMPKPIDPARLQELIVFKLKNSVTLTTQGDRMIKVSYRGVNSSLNARIVNKIVQGFVEDSLHTDRSSKQAVVDFYKEQQDEFRKKLEDSERKVAEFREKHFIEMPADAQASASAIRTDKERMIESNIELERLNAQLKAIDTQIAAQEKNITTERTTTASPRTVQLQKEITNLEIELIRMKATLTEKNPRVIELEGSLAQLKQELDSTQNQTVTNEVVAPNPLLQKLQEQKGQVTSLIEAERKRLAMLKANVDAAEKLIKGKPSEQQELTKLEREYAVNKQIYNMLVSRLAVAEMDKKIAQGQEQAETYEIVEVARDSNIPIGSARLRIILMGIVAGLGLGAAIVAALEIFDQSFRDPKSVEECLNIELLSTIPVIMTQNEMRMRMVRRATVLAVLGAAICCELFAAAVVSGII